MRAAITRTNFYFRTAKQSLVSALNNNPGPHTEALDPVLVIKVVVDMVVVWVEVLELGPVVKFMFRTLVSIIIRF